MKRGADKEVSGGVEFVGADIVHLDKNTFMWVQLTHFAISLAESDEVLLASLIASPAYAHDYASPCPSHPQPFDTAIHGRWNLSAIAVDRFVPRPSADAIAQLKHWANDQDWTDPDYRQPQEVLKRLDSVFDLMRSGAVYQLDNPSDDDMHEYGFVTGEMGFHEFVVINHPAQALHVIVASDD
ncbi:MAG: hypothetical protein FWE71_11980 [Nocardioidaceae bacterium]|nr:hypothetical protein [Nocardioidaceae bacterium]MCL2613807.1 hypothetical protein [Nocardioidaceae bacterium]